MEVGVPLLAKKSSFFLLLSCMFSLRLGSKPVPPSRHEIVEVSDTHRGRDVNRQCTLLFRRKF